MNEPKRRGRPPKGIVRLTVDQVADDMASGVRVMLTTVESERAVAQAYAQRVWDGQSDTVTRKERLERVAKALEGQGLSMEGVSL